MLKPRGPVCNLDCQYCFYLKKEALYPSASFRMSDETLETYVRSYIEAQRVPEATFAWQGGTHEGARPILAGAQNTAHGRRARTLGPPQGWQ